MVTKPAKVILSDLVGQLSPEKAEHEDNFILEGKYFFHIVGKLEHMRVFTAKKGIHRIHRAYIVRKIQNGYFQLFTFFELIFLFSHKTEIAGANIQFCVLCR